MSDDARTPDEPDAAGTPEEPRPPGPAGPPEGPATPEGPTTPSAAGSPERPTTPGAAGSPEGPGTPEGPSTPSAAGSPEGPGTPEGPSTPGAAGPPSAVGTPAAAGASAGASRQDEAELRRLRAQVAELQAPRSRWKSALSAVLITVACIIAPLAIVASWASSIIGDTNRYVAMVGPLTANPSVQAAIANRTAQAVSQHIDVNDLLQQVAPTDRPKLDAALGKLSGPIDNAITSFVQKQTQNVVASSWFQGFWVDANRRIHQTMVKALTGQGGGAVQLTQNSVVIDLAPVIDQVKQRLVSNGMTIAAKIPEIHTNFTVISNQNIGKAKTGFRLLQIVGNWLGVIGVLLTVAGVWLARRWRRAAVAASFGIAAGALVLGIGLTVFRAIYLDKLPADVNQDAAKAIYDQLVLFLRTAVRSVVVLGIAVGLGFWLAGHGRRAARIKGVVYAGVDATRGALDNAGMKLGPVGPFVHRYHKWIMWIVLAAGGLTLALWSYPTGMVVFWIVVIVVVALLVVRFLDEERPAAPTTPEGLEGS
ncbi:hypothetical protein [Streptacidiphilus neutrinimicus]|uniref:hypothetical protein n=1 Tax=Streptacidiphilus neutrinimicus TaxID=105420 RepID=UPI001F31EDD6|nr:hypothetical protein [Streptacidiphilus neutrinimicus]